MEKRGQSEIVAAAYDEGAESYRKNWNAPHPWMEDSRREFAERVSKGMTLLDVGCGPGHDSDYWTKKGLKTLGVDLSPKTIDLAKSSYPSLDFRVADILTLREAENFDAVWMSYSFLHIPKASAANLVRSIGRLIKPGGFFFVETSIADTTREEVRPIAGLTDGEGRKIEVPYTFWTVPELTDLLQPAFIVEWSKTYTPDGRPPMVWAGIMRRGRKKL